MAGASMVLLCTNTMHKLSDEIEARISIPFLHIADAAAARVKEQGLTRVGLLGTKFTMEQEFYRQRLTDKHGLKVLVPDAAERDEIHRIIYEEICAGQFKPESKEKILAAANNLARAGAEGVLLGCTELELLANKAKADVPLFETTRIHAETAVAEVLNDDL
jgi:aspartate racemase